MARHRSDEPNLTKPKPVSEISEKLSSLNNAKHPTLELLREALDPLIKSKRIQFCAVRGSSLKGVDFFCDFQGHRCHVAVHVVPEVPDEQA